MRMRMRMRNGGQMMNLRTRTNIGRQAGRQVMDDEGSDQISLD